MRQLGVVARMETTGNGTEIYFRAPRWGCFNFDWRRLAALRLGLLMMKVPLPMYSAL
jgi:hypothetical protein